MKSEKSKTSRLPVGSQSLTLPLNTDFERLRFGKGGHIDPRLVCLLTPRSSEAERYARLRFAVESLRCQEQGLVVGVTSPGTGDGKTLTAINLAGSLAQDVNARVLLVDLDLRGKGGNVRDFIELKSLSGPGVADWISSGDLEKEGMIRYLPGFNLHMLSAGEVIDFRYEILKSDRLDTFFEKARQAFDFIVVDCPEVLLLPDTELISRFVDGYLIVVKAEHTPRKSLAETLNLMTRDKVIGLVFNSGNDKYESH